MKEKVLAIALLIILPLAVILNTIILTAQIDETINAINSVKIEESGAKGKAESIFEDFSRKESFLSLTVSHDDLTNIEDCFTEMIGYLSVGDTKNAEVMRNRLIHSLEHLRRLSGFNIDAII